MQRVKDPAAVPPGGLYRYKDPETGTIITHPYFVQVRARAHKFRVDNNLPIGAAWEAQFEDNVCQNTKRCACEPSAEDERTLWQMAKSFASSMKTWAENGFTLASDEIIQERRAVCEGLNGQPRCEYWHNSGTRYWSFGRCGVCGCATGLKSGVLTETCPKGKWKR